MPMSDPSEFLQKVSHVLLLLLLMVIQRRLAQFVPPQINNPVPESDAGTFHESHILVPNMETSLYLLRNKERNLTFTWDEEDQVNYLSFTVTTCGARVKWLFLQKMEKKVTELSQYEGEGRQKREYQNPKNGVYLIRMTSLVSDSYVKVYLTYDMFSVYPNLPPDPRINISTNSSMLSLSWPSAVWFNALPVEYCLSINRVKKLHTYCGVIAYLKENGPSNKTVWNSSIERKQMAEVFENAHPLKAWPTSKLFYKCVSNKTSFTYSNVKRGKTYFVEVFALIKKGKTIFSSAYSSTAIKIKRTKISTLRMQVGESKTVKLKNPYKVKVKLNATFTKLAFEVMPCEGKIPFEIHYNGIRIQRMTLVKRWHRRLLQVAHPGTYILTFPRTKKKTFVTISIKTNVTRSKLVLPNKFLIKAHKRMSSCQSIRLEWTAAKIKQKYCVYGRELKGHDQLRRRCLSVEKRPIAERLVCFYSNGTDATNEQRMEYTVQGLTPATRYRFDVFVSRGQSSSLPYKSVTVKTNRCRKFK